MSPEIFKALELTAVGMIAVFVVLFSVTLAGSFLIRQINRFAPAAPKPPLKAAPGSQNLISPRKTAAVTAGIEAFTGGKGRLVSIRKIN